MIASTTAFLAAGKFGLAPTVKNGTGADCKLVPRTNAAGLITNDPSGAACVVRQGALQEQSRHPTPHRVAAAARVVQILAAAGNRSCTHAALARAVCAVHAPTSLPLRPTRSTTATCAQASQLSTRWRSAPWATWLASASCWACAPPAACEQPVCGAPACSSCEGWCVCAWRRQCVRGRRGLAVSRRGCSAAVAPATACNKVACAAVKRYCSTRACLAGGVRLLSDLVIERLLESRSAALAAHVDGPVSPADPEHIPCDAATEFPALLLPAARQVLVGRAERGGADAVAAHGLRCCQQPAWARCRVSCARPVCAAETRHGTLQVGQVG